MNSWLTQAHTLAAEGRTFALVTITSIKGSTPRAAGAHMIVLPDGSFHGSVGGGQLEAEVLADAKETLASAIASPRRYPLCFRTGQCCGGSVDVFIEIIGLGPRLYLFGAGHVGQSLAQTMVGTPFRVHLIDQRREWIEHPEVPASTVRHLCDPAAFIRQAEWDSDRTFALVMTHDHQIDLEIVRALLDKPQRFLGLIGSRHKWERFQKMLGSMGVGASDLARVTCPIGLGGWGKAPREIAISVAAQLLQLSHDID